MNDNGNQPKADISRDDYVGYLAEQVDQIGQFLNAGHQDLAASHGQEITRVLLAAPASFREELYRCVGAAIAELPDDIQAAAYCLAEITPPETQPPAGPDTPRPNLVADIPLINPALDYARGVVYIAQQRTVTGDDCIKSVPVIFTSQREYFVCPAVKGANELRIVNNQVAIDKNLERAGSRWSFPAILQFIELGGEVDPWQLYYRVERVFRERCYLVDEGNYLILALYTMLSYVYPVFDAVPYLHLTGMPGSGKTHVARIMAALSFNGHIEVDPTEASLFRTIEATRGLVVLDDQEVGVTNRSHSQNPFMTILKVGYKRGGQVTRMERRGNDFCPLTFDVYCPKVITNVFGLEDILADRTIPILMRGLPPNLDRPVNTSPLSATESQPIVDDLFLFAMQHTPEIARLASEPSSHRSRTEEIFAPLFVLATFVDMAHHPDSQRSILGELSEILEQKAGERDVIRTDTPEATLRLALLNLLEKRGRNGDWFSAREIEKEFYALHSSPPDWYNDRWLGRNIGKVAALRPQDRKRDAIERQVPRFDYRTGQELDDLETKRFTYYYVRRDSL